MLILLMARMGLANYLAGQLPGVPGWPKTSMPWWEGAISLNNKAKPRPAAKANDKYDKPEWGSLPDLGSLYDCSSLSDTNIPTPAPKEDCGIISETNISKHQFMNTKLNTRY